MTSCNPRSSRTVPSSRSPSLVVPQQPTQPCPTFDRDGVGRIVLRLGPISRERDIPHRLMRALGVIVLDVLRDQVVEVVQRFLLQALNEPLDVRLQVRRTDAVLLHLDTGVSKHLVETGPVDPVTIAEQKCDFLAVRLHVLDELLRLLLHPRGIRLSRAFRHVDLAAAEVQKYQHEILLQAELRDDSFGEEVALVQHFRMPL